MDKAIDYNFQTGEVTHIPYSEKDESAVDEILEDLARKAFEKEKHDVCKNCYFCHKLKELVNREWVIRNVCTIFPQTEPDDGWDSFALVIDDPEIGRCEVFTERKNKNG